MFIRKARLLLPAQSNEVQIKNKINYGKAIIRNRKTSD